MQVVNKINIGRILIKHLKKRAINIHKYMYIQHFAVPRDFRPELLGSKSIY